MSPANELKEGDNVTISCHTDSVPVGRLVLRRVSEGQKTALRTSSESTTAISLPSVQLSDSGLYECEALNEHGSQSASTRVIVKGKSHQLTLIFYDLIFWSFKKKSVAIKRSVFPNTVFERRP